MRRIASTKYRDFNFYAAYPEPDAVIISRRDYRLLLAVARAAESMDDAMERNRSTQVIAHRHLHNQLAFLNAKVKA
jgi:hypothetical protein